MRILLVEDDVELSGAVERRLRASGFAIDAVATLGRAAAAVEVNEYACPCSTARFPMATVSTSSGTFGRREG